MPNAAASSARRRAILAISPCDKTAGGDTGRAAHRLVAELVAAGEFDFVWAAGRMGPTFGGKQRWPLPGIDNLKGLAAAVAHADLVWLHDTSYPAAVAAFRAARRHKKPVMITQHSGPRAAGAAAGNKLKARAAAFATERMLRAADQATFTSDALAEYYHRRLAFRAPVKIIPNGVELERLHPAAIEQRREMRQRLALRDNTPVLLYAAPFDQRHGIGVVRHLAPLLPGWHLWLAGAGPVDPAAWLLPNIHVFRAPAPEKMAALYQCADRLIVPQEGGGFPLAIQEAMACGLPVVASPATAAGNRLAAPHILTAPVNAADPAATAALWTAVLEKQRAILPLIRPKTELADLAQIFWQGPKIAAYYGDLLRALLRTAPPVAVQRRAA